MRNGIAKKIVLLFVLCFGLYGTTAQAELIQISLSATVNYARDDGGYLEGKIDVGSVISGSYIYESTTPDSRPSELGVGDYYHYTLPAGVFLTVGGFEFKTGDSIELNMFTRDNIPDDRYGFYSSKNLSLSNGTSVDSISWYLVDSTATALSSDALPVTAPVLSQWQSNFLDIEGEGGGYRLEAIVNSVELVPEPATFLLLMLGSFLLKRCNSN